MSTIFQLVERVHWFSTGESLPIFIRVVPTPVLITISAKVSALSSEVSELKLGLLIYRG